MVMLAGLVCRRVCVSRPRCPRPAPHFPVYRYSSSSSLRARPGPQLASKMYTCEPRGSEFSPDYRLYFRDEQGPISAMHDIPVWADRTAGVVNMVVEVPRWSTAKMEISLAEPLNPVKQDVKKGALRHVANVFPHRGYMWNYGALPQTWENPHHVDPDTQARGDNDPLDVLELGRRVLPRGSVVRVKVLGALALLDEGEMDWKLLAIDERDELAGELSGPADLERLMPGLLRASVEWFRLYKVPDGKPPNEFAWGGAPRPRDVALRLIDDMHGFWRGLLAGDIASDIRTDNTTVDGSKTRLSRDRAAEIVSAAPPPALPQTLPDSVDKWHFLANL